jgi:predicted nucleic acid-binding protein
LTGKRVAYDTNILAYIRGVEAHPNDAAKIIAVRVFHANLAKRCTCVAPLQALGELYSVLARHKQDRQFAQAEVASCLNEFQPIVPDIASFTDAIELATEHKLQFWDSLILSTAASGGCSLLLSEDMQNGFAWRGVTVVNPFAAKLHKRLARVLE